MKYCFVDVVGGWGILKKWWYRFIMVIEWFFKFINLVVDRLLLWVGLWGKIFIIRVMGRVKLSFFIVKRRNFFGWIEGWLIWIEVLIEEEWSVILGKKENDNC